MGFENIESRRDGWQRRFISAVPAGLFTMTPDPGVETPGDSKMSLRDIKIPRRPMPVRRMAMPACAEGDLPAAIFRNVCGFSFKAKQMRVIISQAVERRKESSPRREPWETHFPGGQAAEHQKKMFCRSCRSLICRKTKSHSWHWGLVSGAAPQLFAHRDFPKRHGFFFQGEANERGHFNLRSIGNHIRRAGVINRD